MKLSSGVARIAEMMAKGVPVGLGVDGSASNDASNLANELRIAYLLQRLYYKANAPTGAQLLHIATQGGADLLHREDIGSLEVDKCADLFMVSKDRLSLAGCFDDVAAIPATIGFQEPVDLTMVGGKVIYRNRKFENVEMNGHISKVNRHSSILR